MTNLRTATVEWLLARIERLNDERVILLDSLRRQENRQRAKPGRIAELDKSVLYLDEQIGIASDELIRRPRAIGCRRGAA